MATKKSGSTGSRSSGQKRATAVRAATSKVRAKTTINFNRSIRGK